MSLPQGARGAVRLGKNICCAHYLLFFSFPMAGLQMSYFKVQSLYRALAVTLRKGHGYSYPSPWFLPLR